MRIERFVGGSGAGVSAADGASRHTPTLVEG
jgi:hypothetical protein